MFYCEECRKMNKWPESMAMSIGPCEVCKQMRSCYDVKSSNLPIPPDKSKHTAIDCPICNREYFVGDIVNTANLRKFNSHDGLVKACQALVNSHGMHGPCEQNSCQSCRTAYTKAKQALAGAVTEYPKQLSPEEAHGIAASMPETVEGSKAEQFVRHIEAHLTEGQVVVCKICDKTIDEIYSPNEPEKETEKS